MLRHPQVGNAGSTGQKGEDCHTQGILAGGLVKIMIDPLKIDPNQLVGSCSVSDGLLQKMVTAWLPMAAAGDRDRKDPGGGRRGPHH